MHGQQGSWGAVWDHFWGPHAMPQTHIWTVTVLAAWEGLQLAQGLLSILLGFGVQQGDADAPRLSSRPPAPLTTQKPGPAITDLPWSPAQGLLKSSFCMHMALQQGRIHGASPRQGTQEPGTTQ